MDKEKQTTTIYIFGYKFVITSELFGDCEWVITVSLGNLKEKYTDYVENKAAAEQACFGYFLAKHCQGGIYWQEPPKEDIPNLLAEQIGLCSC